MARAASSHPQTGDNTEPSLFVLLAVSAGVTGMGVLWLRRKYARIYGGK
ncbi:LPXTG cell wall anchor domain-containing protein [Ruminococcus sp. OF03-6AA]|nr:LPXTG cell wall anchor domain-containing protein [Ruminococcus sp. OF03-6AA]